MISSWKRLTASTAGAAQEAVLRTCACGLLHAPAHNFAASHRTLRNANWRANSKRLMGAIVLGLMSKHLEEVRLPLF
jgi:hypothetical protein